jgi:alkyl hydroperoxide reductase subunit AhpC
MLAVGDRIPEAAVWTTERERIALAELVADGPALFFFYLFDFSST